MTLIYFILILGVIILIHEFGLDISYLLKKLVYMSMNFQLVWDQEFSNGQEKTMKQNIQLD